MNRRAAVWAALIVVIGLAIRLHEAGYNFDGDEVFSVRLASRSFSEVIAGSLQDRPHPPLHNILLHFWIKLFGPSETSTRALSALFSGGFLLSAFALLRRFMTAGTALGVLALMAVSPLFVYYGQQVRAYSLILFLFTFNVLMFFRVREVPDDRRRLTAWAASCVLVLYTQYIAILSIGIQIGFAVFFLRSRRWKVLAYGLAGCLCIVPWFLVAMGRTVSEGGDPLTHISWMKPPVMTDLMWFYTSVFGEVPGLRTRWLTAALAVPAVAYARHCIVHRKFSADHLLLFLLAFGVPLFVLAESIWGPKPVFAPRQLLGPAVVFAILIGIWARTMPGKFAVAFLTALLIWTAAALPDAFARHAKPPWRELVEQIDSRYGPVTVVVQDEWVAWPLEHYLKGAQLKRWEKLTAAEKEGGFLFVCRPGKNSAIESAEFDSRRRLAGSWTWGRSGASNPNIGRLYLYEIR